MSSWNLFDKGAGYFGKYMPFKIDIEVYALLLVLRQTLCGLQDNVRP